MANAGVGVGNCGIGVYVGLCCKNLSTSNIGK
jgi:hypothetical protein